MIILIAGKKRSGKDFVTNLIKAKLELEHRSFASRMKRIVAKTFDITLEELEDMKNNSNEEEIMLVSSNKYRTITMRKILERFGTDAIYPEFGDDIWARLEARDIICNDRSKDYIYSDFRFPHEYKQIEQTDHSVFTCLVYDGQDPLPTDHISNNRALHEANFQYDFVIDNSKKDNSVYGQVDSFIDLILNRKLNTRTPTSYTVSYEDGEID